MQAMMPSPTLAEALFPQVSLRRNVALVVLFSVFTALMAQLSIVLPFTPVPVTGQTLAVLLVGMVLGPKLGMATLMLYLVEGMMGLPVFAQGKAGWAAFAGPTMGYLAAFPLTAGLVGWLAQKGWDKNPLGILAAMVLGNFLIYALGVTWLTSWLVLAGKEMTLQSALNMGMTPFLIGDAVKIVVAMVLLPGSWALLNRYRQG